jgi:hypothetical protein
MVQGWFHGCHVVGDWLIPDLAPILSLASCPLSLIDLQLLSIYNQVRWIFHFAECATQALSKYL